MEDTHLSPKFRLFRWIGERLTQNLWAVNLNDEALS